MKRKLEAKNTSNEKLNVEGNWKAGGQESGEGSGFFNVF
jgi:hypothetical protein